MMGWNLPPGVTLSMIPGNSDRDLAIERQQEKIDGELDKLPDWLKAAILKDADFDTIAERCNWLYELAFANDEPAAMAIEETRNLAQEGAEW